MADTNSSNCMVDFISQHGLDERYARHHRRSAELIYRTALRLEGWFVKACQFIGTRADILRQSILKYSRACMTKSHLARLH